MLKALLPLTLILAAVGVGVRSITIFLIHFVPAFIFSTIFPGVNTLAMHDTLIKVTFKMTAIRPREYSAPRHFILTPLALIA